MRYICYKMVIEIGMNNGNERKIHFKIKLKLIRFGVEMHSHLILNCHPILIFVKYKNYVFLEHKFIPIALGTLG